MQPQTESSVASIVHDVVDNDIAHAEENADQAHVETQEVASAVIDHVVIDAQEHESLRSQLEIANTRIAELENQWQETHSVPEPEPIEETITEPIEVEIAAPPSENQSIQKQKRYLFNHPLRK
jgi:hypothetical protein